MRTIFIFLAILVLVVNAGEQNVASKVVEVSVFTDRALVKRATSVDLAKGQHTLVFSDITTDINDESVRIDVPGYNARILDVKIERRFTTQARVDNLREISDKIDKLKQEDKVTNDKIAVLDSKKEFVEALKAESGRYYSQTMLLKANAVKQWNASLQFIEKNLTGIYSEIRVLLTRKDQIAEDIRVLEFEKEQLSYTKRQDYKEIIVKVDALQAGKIELYPTYLVNNAGWYPIYDARVNTQQKQAELSYYAMIRQTTGEDWHDIQMTLSTADPVTITTLPELESWVLDTRRPAPVRKAKKPTHTSTANYSMDYQQNRGLPAGKGSVSGYVLDIETGEALAGANLYFEGTNIGVAADLNGKFTFPDVEKGGKTLAVRYIGYRDLDIKMVIREKYNADLVIELEAQAIENEMITVVAEKPLIQQSISHSSVVTKGPVRLEFSDAYSSTLSTIFALKTKNSIPSDNNAHKITIFKENLAVAFNYISIPRINARVFLKGKIINATPYPLLEGDLNVFVDNDFVNSTWLGIVPPTDTLQLALGVDDNIRIEKSLVKRFVESKGLLGGSKRITYDLEVKVKNNRSTNERIEIKDQLPIAANEKIKIELLKPSKEEKILTKSNHLIWHLTLKAGEERVLPIKYYVEFPEDLPVYGLE